MSGAEDLMIGAGRPESGERLWNTLGSAASASPTRNRALALRKAIAVLDFLTIRHVAGEQRPDQPSPAAEKLLELGRPMMSNARNSCFPRRVGAGVNRTLLYTISDTIKRLNQERGYTFVVIEHDMEFIGRICDPVICMAEGKVLAEGTLDQIKANEAVIEAYLGTGLKNRAKVGA